MSPHVSHMSEYMSANTPVKMPEYVSADVREHVRIHVCIHTYARAHTYT